MASPDQDLHETAVNAAEALSDLSTGLAQEGADGNVVETVRKMEKVMHKIVRALGPGAEQQEAASAPQPPPPAQQQEAAPGPPPTLDAATRHLQDSMRAAAAARQGG